MNKTMANEEIYQSLNDKEGLKLPSTMGIVPREENALPFDALSVEKALRKNKQFTVKSFAPSDEENSFESQIEYDGIEYEVSLWLCPTEGLEFESYSFANTIDEESTRIR